MHVCVCVRELFRAIANTVAAVAVAVAAIIVLLSCYFDLTISNLSVRVYACFLSFHKLITCCDLKQCVTFS